MRRLLEQLRARVELAWAILVHGGPRPTRRAPPPTGSGAAPPPAPLPSGLREGGALLVPPPSASRAAPSAPQLPPYVPISEKQLDHVRGIARREDWPEIRLCRGPKKGCTRTCAWVPAEDCSSCFVVPWHERRASAELLRVMERGDA